MDKLSDLKSGAFFKLQHLIKLHDVKQQIAGAMMQAKERSNIEMRPLKRMKRTAAKLTQDRRSGHVSIFDRSAAHWTDTRSRATPLRAHQTTSRTDVPTPQLPLDVQWTCAAFLSRLATLWRPVKYFRVLYSGARFLIFG
jgi:hypothetical protein